MPKRIVYVAPDLAVPHPETLAPAARALREIANDTNVFESIRSRRLLFNGTRSYDKFGPARWVAEERNDSTGAPETDFVGTTSTSAYWYRAQLEKRARLAPHLHADEIASLPTGRDVPGSDSVQKKVYAEHAMVVVKNDRSDYTKEDKAFRTLYGAGQPPPQDEIPWFSFQKALTEAEAEAMGTLEVTWKDKKKGTTTNVRLAPNNFRRYSVYGGTERAEEDALEAPGCKNTNLRDYLKLILRNPLLRLGAFRDLRARHIANLWGCLHQVVKIHHLLYMKRMTHGDMHMGNMKVIIANAPEVSGVVCKAFDFGKLKTQSQFTRTDLRYLVNKTAVPRHLGNSSYETNNRAGRWRDEQRNPNVDRLDRTDWKHYPLHRILEAQMFLHGYTFTRQNENAFDTRIHGLVQDAGRGFLDFLGGARDPRKGTNDAELLETAVERAFAMFANVIVEEFYARFGDIS